MLFIFLYVLNALSACLSVCHTVLVPLEVKRTSESPELELKVVRATTYMLGTKAKSPMRATSAVSD